MKRAFLAIAVLAAPLFADEVHLRGGGRLTGQILAQTESDVTIDIGAGSMTVPMSTVVGIDRSTSPLQEYRERVASMSAGDIEEWRKLARWATGQGLSAQARDAYQVVHNAHPDDAEANRALGLVFHDNRWMTEEQTYEARGYVRYGGDWMLPAERDSILRDEEARAEANRLKVAAQVRESEATRKEEDAEEQRREDEERARNRLPTLGDPLWGYNYVPSVW